MNFVYRNGRALLTFRPGSERWLSWIVYATVELTAHDKYYHSKSRRKNTRCYDDTRVRARLKRETIVFFALCEKKP